MYVFEIGTGCATIVWLLLLVMQFSVHSHKKLMLLKHFQSQHTAQRDMHEWYTHSDSDYHMMSREDNCLHLCPLYIHCMSAAAIYGCTPISRQIQHNEDCYNEHSLVQCTKSFILLANLKLTTLNWYHLCTQVLSV